MVPGLLGLVGGTSAGLAVAPALRALTWPLLAITVVVLGRGWFLDLSHGGWRSPWAKRARLTLTAATALSASLWALRFAGVLGARPF